VRLATLDADALGPDRTLSDAVAYLRPVTASFFVVAVADALGAEARADGVIDAADGVVETEGVAEADAAAIGVRVRSRLIALDRAGADANDTSPAAIPGRGAASVPPVASATTASAAMGATARRLRRERRALPTSGGASTSSEWRAGAGTASSTSTFWTSRFWTSECWTCRAWGDEPGSVTWVLGMAGRWPREAGLTILRKY